MQFAARECPASSVLGTAEADTPLLEEPLKGNVYLRSSPQGLPDSVADLRGQFEVELVGRIDTVNKGALRTTFETVPDAPVSTFVLDLQTVRRGCCRTATPLRRDPEGHRPNGRPERQGVEPDTEAADDLQGRRQI